MHPFKKILLLWVLLGASFINSNASQYAGGEITYKVLRTGVTDNDYEITLLIQRNRKSLAEFTPPGIWILNSTNPSLPVTQSFFLPITETSRTALPPTVLDKCVVNKPQETIELIIFKGIITLPVSMNGYTLLFSDCCRDKPQLNRAFSGTNQGVEIIGGFPESGQGLTILTRIPPQIITPVNSSPVSKDSLITSCEGEPFKYKLNYTDPDGDSLVFIWSNPAEKLNTPSILINYLDYADPYSGFLPLGGNPLILLDPVSGIIQGTPQRAGKFVICIDILEYRQGSLINIHRKEFQLIVSKCKLSLPAVPVNCENLTALFLNHENNPENQYAWDFGVPGMDSDTSSRPYTFYNYPEPGEYKVTLIVNAKAGCADTISTVVRIFPGLKPSFKWNDPVCNGEKLLLENTADFQWGTITSFEWKQVTPYGIVTFARGPNAFFNYSSNNLRQEQYSIELHVATDIGCSGSVLNVVYVYPQPSVSAGPDTTLGFNVPYEMPVIPLQQFNYEWTPATGLSNPSVANPILLYDQNQKYILKVSDNKNNCFSYDTVYVRYAKGPELYVPNAFTPNGDGLNDVLQFKAVNIIVHDFIIYNRYGQQVFTYSKHNRAWNGLYKNLACEPGTYYWKATVTEPGNKKSVKKGSILVIR